MSEVNTAETAKKVRKVHHTGRTSQVWIYLGKQFRFFINENDWKVLPMAAVIAGLVAMVIRKKFFVNMEGSLIGAFALTCVAIWNGCFNSIQSVCRERAIIKREHRSGMHISAYMGAHMIYQFLLCAAQTALTMFVLRQLSVPIPRGYGSGIITPWMICDLGISMFLISYASDMMSLFLSSISRTTTGAMTLMPFILIFQLVFSGGIIPLPEWSRPLSNFTISNYGIRALASQSGYNELPMTSVWNSVSGMKNSTIGRDFTVAELMEKLDSPAIEKFKDRVVLGTITVGDAQEVLGVEKDEHSEETLTNPITVGQVVELLKNSKYLNEHKDKTISLKTTVGDVLDILGEENVKNFVQQKTAEAAHKDEYESSMQNIARNWLMLGVFIAVFAALATLMLELIDKDKR